MHQYTSNEALLNSTTTLLYFLASNTQGYCGTRRPVTNYDTFFCLRRNASRRTSCLFRRDIRDAVVEPYLLICFFMSITPRSGLRPHTTAVAASFSSVQRAFL